MLGWWSELPTWLQIAVALTPILIATVMLICGWFWPWGFGIGFVLLLFSGKSDSQKRGYHD